jgi:uncharacterized protein
MAKDDRPRDQIGYEALQHQALRGVIREALRQAAGPRGLPGDHHFYISFRTQAADVVIPEELVSRYPDEMTIVLQNQFWDLNPGPDAFSITLQFSGQPKSLSIPYSAVTRFYDPSVQYLLQFPAAPAAPRAPAPKDKAASGPARDDEAAPAAEGPKIVSLDQFRKK